MMEIIVSKSWGEKQNIDKPSTFPQFLLSIIALKLAGAFGLMRGIQQSDTLNKYIKDFQEPPVNLRRIFGRKGDANGEWRRLHNEKLHSLLRSPNIVREIKSR